MTQRLRDLTLSVIATIVAFLLSWPFWRDFEFWAESHTAWILYFIVGFVMAVYVFYVFLDCVRILFLHDEIEKKKGGSKYRLPLDIEVEKEKGGDA